MRLSKWICSPGIAIEIASAGEKPSIAWCLMSCQLLHFLLQSDGRSGDGGLSRPLPAHGVQDRLNSEFSIQTTGTPSCINKDTRITCLDDRCGSGVMC